MAKPDPTSVSALIPGDGWYCVWGSTAPAPYANRHQRVIAFALASDGSASVPVVANETGDLVNASSVSDDYVVDHPNQWSRSTPSGWPTVPKWD